MAALTANSIPKATDGTHIGDSSLIDTGAVVTTAVKLSPASDDGAPLGDTTHNFSDIFLATGALVNFANSNAVITHSSGILTVSTGDLRVTTAGANAASVVTVGGTQTLTNKTLTAPVIGAATGTSLALTDNISTGVGSGLAGTVVLTEGTAPSLTANAFSIYAPVDVAAGGLAYIPPAAAATGFVLATNAAGVMTLSHVASTGSGSVVLATSPSLTTPVLGTPSSGTLSACTVDGTNLVGFKGMPQNSQSTAYTTVLGDAGKHILHPTADNNARTFTIDSNANVAYVIGTTITFINQINTLTLSITSDSLVWLPTGGTGSRTIAANGLATAVKVAATVWNVTGVGIT